MTTTLIYDSNRASDPAAIGLHELAHGIFRKSNSIPQPREDRFYLAAFKVEHSSDKADFLAVSTYVDRRNHSIHDLNCCGLPLFSFAVGGDQESFQQELRLTSADPDSKFDWLAGAHLSRTESTWRLGVSDLPIEQREGTHIQQSQVEGYVQLSRKIGTHMEASAGARLARSSYDYAGLPTPVFKGGNDETLLIPRFDLSYHGKSGNLYYLTAAEGYSGGSVVGIIPGCEPLELLADTLWNYELGTKADIFDGRAHVEASVFDARWGNRQHDPIAWACLTSWQKGQAESDGFELSVQALVGERTTIGLAVSYIDARYTQSVELDGVVIVHAGDAIHNARLPWSLSGYFDYEFPPVLGASVTIHAEDHYHGGNSRNLLENNPASPFYHSFGNADSTTNILNLRANVQIGPADLAVFVNNALASSPLLSEFPIFGTAYTLTPRTVGISANWRF
jgi:outer membrane receptor protein involved in Fe transport